MSVNIKTAQGLTSINSVLVRNKGNLVEKTITANGTYNAVSDNADGYSGVTVNVTAPKEKWLMSHGTEYIRIPKEDLAFTNKPKVVIKFKNLTRANSDEYPLFGLSSLGNGQNTLTVKYIGGSPEKIRTEYSDYRGYSYQQAVDYSNTIYNFTMYVSMGYQSNMIGTIFNSSEEPISQGVRTNLVIENQAIANYDFLIYSALSPNGGTQTNISTAKIAYLHLYDDNTLIFNGIPKINPATGKACLYDSVNDKYYGNANTESQTDFEIVEED